MAVRFANMGQLKLALSAGAVPASVASAEVCFATDNAGVWLNPTGTLSRNTVAALRRYGADPAAEGMPGASQAFQCWAQVLPLEPGQVIGPAWFELTDATVLPDLLAELRRFGKPALDWGIDAEGHGWARVAEPPATSLYRAEGDPDLAVFVEQSPNVWVMSGWRHPLEQPLQPPRGTHAFLRPDRQWSQRNEPTGISARPRFAIRAEARPVDSVTPRVAITARLAVDRQSAPAELWLLRDESLLDAWLRKADERLVARLLVARVVVEGRAALALLARPGRAGPPVLVIPADTYRPYLKLPNLFVPTGRKLNPPLRRDLARRAFAADGDELVWLDEGLKRTAVPVASFQPLPQFVRYRAPSIEVWTSTEPDPWMVLEQFVVKDRPSPPRLKPVVRPAQATSGGVEPATPARWQSLFAWVKGAWMPTTRPPVRPETEVAAVNRSPADDAELQTLRVIEAGGPISAEQWAALAEAEFAAGRAREAAILWPIAIWNVESPPARWTEGWLASETAEHPLTLTGDATHQKVRAAAAFVVHSVDTMKPGDWLDTVREWLTNHEGWLGVRAAWLAHRALARWCGGDPLGLARVRDRLFHRLYDTELLPDTDVPAFLVAADPAESSRRRSARDWLPGQLAVWQRWLGARGAPVGSGEVRLDRFGLARERYTTSTLMEGIWRVGCTRVGAGPAELPGPATELNAVAGWIDTALRFRQQQISRGVVPRGGWPDEFLQARAKLSPSERYGVDKARQYLRALEPEGETDAFAAFQGRAVHSLASAGESGDFARLLSEHLDAEPVGSPARLQTLFAAAVHAPRFGPDVTRIVLDHSYAALEPFRTGSPQFELLIAAWRSAGAARIDGASENLTRITTAALTKRAWSADAAGRLLAIVGPVLQRLDQIDRLRSIVDRVDAACRRTDADAQAYLLHRSAADWRLGNDARAATGIEQVQSAVHNGDVDLPTILAYVAAIGPAPASWGHRRLEDLFRHLPATVATATTDAWYNLAALRIIDGVVAAVASDAPPGPMLERWLHQEQLRIRERIRRDLGAEE
ncbi:MAG: hypothetical protein K1X57_17560 [Gemmataceae bacterium]|nr:hypothetical protein [Gemmataceae bacterium]